MIIIKNIFLFKIDEFLFEIDLFLFGLFVGLGFRPMPPSENIESTLIWYKGTNYENYRQWTDSLDEFLKSMYHVTFFFCSKLIIFFVMIGYKTPGSDSPGRGQNIFDCKYNSPPPPGKVCNVNIKDFKKCTQENHYSYHKSSPCVFIKLNRIYGWVPEFYNNTNSLPAQMPKQLKQMINTTDPMEVCINVFFFLIDRDIFEYHQHSSTLNVKFRISVEHGLDIVRR